jgi:hypothetical protein
MVVFSSCKARLPSSERLAGATIGQVLAVLEGVTLKRLFTVSRDGRGKTWDMALSLGAVVSSGKRKRLRR